MSDFTQESKVANPLAQYEARQAKAAAELARMRQLVEALPKDAPVPVDVVPFGYCAEMGMKFTLGDAPEPEKSASFQALLQAYPPVPLVDLPHVRTQKPVSHLRGAELNEEQHQIHPVLFQSSKLSKSEACLQKAAFGNTKGRWWTQTSVGLVEVAVDGAYPALLQLRPGAWQPDSHEYATGLQTMHKRVLKDYSTELSAFTPWYNVWNQFAATLRSPGARNLVNSASTMVSMGHEHQFQERCRDRIAQYFTEAELAALLALLAPQKEALQKAHAENKAALGRASDWLKAFLATISNVPQTPTVTAALKQQLQKAVGANVRLNSVRTEYGHHKVMISLDGTLSHDGIFCQFEVAADPARPKLTLDMLNPEYEEE